MGVSAFATSVGFFAAFSILRSVVLADPNEWRPAWAGIGAVVLILGLIGGLLVRPHSLETETTRRDTEVMTEVSFTLGEALRSPAFWTFSLATSFYGLVVAGTSLFNES